jgi:hypothetical protein
MVLAGNQGAFWLSIHRYSGLYSDPNAFGVVTALLVPLLWIQSGRAGKGVAAVLLIGGLLSGSRTMILGIAVWGVATLWCFVLSRSQRVMLVVGGVVLLGAIGEPSLNDTLRSVLPSTTSERVLRTVNWDTAGEMVWNRSLYSQLAIGAWRRAPFTGVGLERFYEIQGEVASEQGRDLAGWRDNANNFYLKILAEMGAVGLVLTVGALLAFGWSLKKSDPINPVLLSLAVMLLTGPHLDFDEVKYLATVLLAFASAPAVVGLSHRVIVGGVMALYGGAVVVNYRTPLDWGLYPVESLEGKHYRWSSGVGYFTVCADRPIAIRFRSLEPAVAAHPIEVRFTVADGGEEAQRIASNSWHTLQIPTEGRQRVRFVVDRVWSPKAAGLGADARSLGIYLEWPETACRK